VLKHSLGGFFRKQRSLKNRVSFQNNDVKNTTYEREKGFKYNLYLETPALVNEIRIVIDVFVSPILFHLVLAERSTDYSPPAGPAIDPG
jgi:hypothetical protein